MKNIKTSDSLKVVFQLLEKADLNRIFVILLASMSLSVLDLVSVALFGVIGALTVGNLSGQEAGNRISIVLQKLDITDMTFQRQILVISLISLTLALARYIFSLLLFRWQTKFLAEKSAETSSEIFQSLLSFPGIFRAGFSKEELKFSITRGIDSIFIGVVSASLILLSDLFLFTILLVGLLFVSPTIFLITVLYFGLISILITQYSHPKTVKLGRKYADLQIIGDSLVNEGIQSFRTIFVGNRQKKFADKLVSNRISLARVVADIDLLPVQAKAVIEMSIYLLLVSVSGYLFATSDARNSVGVLAIYLGVLSRVGPAVLRVQQAWMRINSSLMTASPTFRLIRSIRTREFSGEGGLDSKEDIAVAPSSAAIVLSNVSYVYKNSEKPALENINLSVNKGEYLAIIGKSGAGKTTLVDLMLGVITPSVGYVRIEGKPPKQAMLVNPTGIAYVPQETFIIRGSIRENILQGLNPIEFSDELIMDAIEFASLTEFVDQLPDKLDTLIGDGQNSLSGGQKQRIGIARAVLSKPRILILDEPTSALDNENEIVISRTLKRISGNVTLVVIAHNMETIKHADRICLVENRKIINIGSASNFEDSYYRERLS